MGASITRCSINTKRFSRLHFHRCFDSVAYQSRGAEFTPPSRSRSSEALFADSRRLRDQFRYASGPVFALESLVVDAHVRCRI